MKRISTAILAVLCLLQGTAFAQLQDKTLRADFIFSGTEETAEIALSKLSVTEGWYGRTVNMDRTPVLGNGQILLVDKASGKTLYASSFSTLFQEWQETQEAKTCRRSFENTFLVPMPTEAAEIKVDLFDDHNKLCCSYTCPVDPKDILIESKAVSSVERKYIWKGADPKEAIDVVILAEGYTAEERETFYSDAAEAVDAMFKHEPYASMKDRFNFLAVAPASKDSGVSVPREGLWKDTPVKSHFDTFYSDRYLTTTDIFRMHDILTGIPYEHLIILANTDTYGGGGIYNSYTLTTAHHKAFRPVVVHEFGHSFGALADEYDYDSGEDPYYFSNVEPWERNITTLVNFDSKWKKMVGSKKFPGVGLIEGAGYQAKGVWRACEDCRMRTNKAEGFCPVCQDAIRSMILFYTEQQ